LSSKEIKTLRVSIIGEPNTGKSTLLNQALNKKYSIVSRKAQTTIKKTTAVFIKSDKQIIFTDTPGIMPNKNKLNRATFKEASNAALDSDIILLLLDIQKDKIDKIKKIISFIKSLNVDFIIVFNKIDLVSNHQYLERISNLKEEINENIIFSISAKKNIGISDLIIFFLENKKFSLKKKIENTNLSKDSNYLEEIVREKVLDNIHDEIPFNLKFVTDKILQNRDKSITVHITILLTKESYKPIILGKKGENIKKISMKARYDLENNLNKKFHLFIFLKVIKSKSLNYKAKV
jgi:GTP-binding protein Era